MAAARALERHGVNCLVFESGAPGGSQSAGESRVFRHAHADPRQTDLAIQARDGWRRWEEEFGYKLISDDGAMAIGEDGIARLRRYAETPGAAAEVREMTPQEVRSTLPILADYEGPALIDEDAGSIQTGLALANLIASVGPNLVSEKVESVAPRPEGGVEITTDTGVRTFDRVVVAVGAATVALAARAGVDIPVKPRVCLRLTMPLVESGPVERLACLQDSSGVFGSASAYGSPVPGNREYAVGLAISTDAAGDGRRAIATLNEQTSSYVKRAMPGLDLEEAVPLERRIAELPWAADGLAIWQAGDAYFVAGNNLFKLAPALGEVIARSLIVGRVEKGVRPEDRLGEPVLGPH